MIKFLLVRSLQEDWGAAVSRRKVVKLQRKHFLNLRKQLAMQTWFLFAQVWAEVRALEVLPLLHSLPRKAALLLLVLLPCRLNARKHALIRLSLYCRNCARLRTRSS